MEYLPGMKQLTQTSQQEPDFTLRKTDGNYDALTLYMVSASWWGGGKNQRQKSIKISQMESFMPQPSSLTKAQHPNSRSQDHRITGCKGPP